jgi:uncharacterized protein (DUF2062 family)
MTAPVSASAPQPSWFQRRVLAPVKAQLAQGTSPDAVALALAVGAACGLFPIFGATTVLTVIVAARLRLNPVLAQLANHLLSPAQLAGMLVFARLGAWLWRAPHVPFSPAALREAFARDFWGTLRHFGAAGLHAVSAWVLVAPLVVLALWLPLRPLMRWVAARMAARRGARAASLE